MRGRPSGRLVRRRTEEMLQFLRIAATSNAEVRSCYHAARGRDQLNTLEHEELLRLNDSIGRMLRRFEQTLSS